MILGKPGFNTPKKEDTLAQKAVKRSRRLIFKSRLTEILPRWWVGTGEILGLAALVGFNFFLLFPFVGQEHQFNGFSAPLIPVLASMISFIMPHAYALRFWLTVFISFLPLTYYFFIREVERRRLTAFTSAFIISLPIDIFLSGRVNLGLVSEDGGHVASLTFTMLVCLFLLRFLKGGGFKMAVFASIGMTIVALTSPLGLLILLCFSLAITFSEMLLNQTRAKLLRFLTVIVLAAGFSAFWYNPKFDFLIINSIQGELIKKTLISLLPLSFFLIPILGVFGFLLFENKPKLQPLFLAIFLTIGFALLFFGAGVEFSSPSRFLPALGISLGFLLGKIIGHFFDYFRTSEKLSRFGIITRFRKLIVFISVVLVLSLFLLIINTSRQNLIEIQDIKVLGLDDIKKAGVWEIRRQSGGIANIFGSIISIATLFFTIFLSRKISSEEQNKI